MACEKPNVRRAFNVFGTMLALLMILSGCLLCADSQSLAAARDFMIGLYLCGFGLFAFLIELKPLTSVTKWCPALESYFGKGFFYAFWGFLLFGRQVGLSIVGFIFLFFGACFMIAQFTVEGPPMHIMGDDKYADSKAAASIERYAGDDSGAPASQQNDPYLSSFPQP